MLASRRSAAPRAERGLMRRRGGAARAARRRRHRRPSVSGRGAGRGAARSAASRSISRPTSAPTRYGGAFPAARDPRHSERDRARPRSDLARARPAATLGCGFAQGAGGCCGGCKPAAVVGFGGYPTVPPLLAATLRGIPTLIHEQNAVMGRANRLLAPRVTAIATGFPGVLDREPALAAKATHTGNPVRPAVIAAAATPYPPLDADGPLQLAGVRRQPGRARHGRHRAAGDRAARAASADAARRSCSRRATRTRRACATTYARLGVAAEVAPFFADLPARMAASHLVVSRSGASTVAELARDRPARHPGAAAACARPGPDAPMPRCWRRPAARSLLEQDGLHAGPAGRRDRRACRRSRAARRAWPAARQSAGALDAADRLAELVVQVGRLRYAQRRHRPGERLAEASHETAARHRPDPFRRHRRHRHERHRRGAGQSRLHGAGLRRRRQRQRQAPARQGHHGRDRPRRRRTSTAPQVVVVSSAIKRDNPGARRGARASGCRWCGAPRCWPS